MYAFLFAINNLCESFFNSTCKLVSAGSSTGTAGVAAKNFSNFTGILAFAELGDCLEVTAASAGEYKIMEDAVFDVEADVGGAGAGSLVAVFHFLCFPFLFQGLNFIKIRKQFLRRMKTWLRF